MQTIKDCFVIQNLYVDTFWLTLPLFIVSMPSQKCEWSCRCMLSILTVSTIFLLDFRTVLMVSYSWFFFSFYIAFCNFIKKYWGRRGRDRMVVEFTITYAISAYHHQRCKFEPRSGEVYSIQHYVIKFVSDLRQVSDFLRLLRFLHQ